MADENLCSVQNVKSRGFIQSDGFDDIILDWIMDMSEEIKFESNNETLTSANLDARRACIYGVLMWLEQKKLISSTKNTTSEREGNISVDYESSTKDTSYKLDLSYSDEYEKYMARLRPMPPVGSKIKCRNSFYYGYGSRREGY